MKQAILIDARNMCHRAFWTHTHLSSKGRPTSVIYGLLNMLLSMQRKIQAPVIFCWDGKGETWRHKLTKGKKREYKGNRKQVTDARQAINQQIPIVKEFIDLLGIWNIEIENLEADDLIGIVATFLTTKLKYDRAIIYSGDRDFLQLVSDKITIWPTQGRNKGLKFITPKQVFKDWGVTPDCYKKMRALCGDKGDNISNIIKGIGSRTAVKLLSDGLDASIENFKALPLQVQQKYADKFQLLWPQVYENYQLCKIVTDISSVNLFSIVAKRLSNVLKEMKDIGIERQQNEIYRLILKFFIEYDLDELFDQRSQFLAIP
jgi:DNA polymerase-1